MRQWFGSFSRCRFLQLPAPFFPCLHEIVGLPAPAERAGINGVASLGTSLGCSDALVERVEDRLFEPLPRELREEHFDGVNSEGGGRSEMERPVPTLLQPPADLDRLVGGDVVENDVNRGSGLGPFGDAVE